jgi:membrane protease YdiL (CAAX protease family)
MSASAISQTSPMESSPRPAWDAIKENASNPMNWLYLVPTIGVLALGVIFAPSTVPIGIGVGVGVFAVTALTLIILKVCNLVAEDDDSEFEKDVLKYPLFGTLGAPFLEEGIFRGLLQPLATRAILFIAPAAAAAFLGTGLSIAVVVSIVGTAAIFGFLHVFNDHKNSHIQAFTCTLQGIAFGVLAAQFGLPAAIAAHVVNNTIALSLAKLFKGKVDEPSQTQSSSSATAANLRA